MSLFLRHSATMTSRSGVLNTLIEAWRTRQVWWFTATSRTRARFVRTYFGSFWLGLSNLFSVAVLAAVPGSPAGGQPFPTHG